MSALAGRRILVVEDEPLIATMIGRQMESLGLVVVGPASTVAAALDRVAQGGFDAALLDMNLRGEPVLPVAEALAARGVPFVYATGYGETPSGYPPAPRIGKPFRRARLDDALRACFDRR